MTKNIKKIKLLSENLINRIAAGEVVERPSSILKELIENSLDAGATNLDINIVNGGKSIIRLADNGYGMTEEELFMCLERHATSKLDDNSDLLAINTLGFRGEALPSIASVSKMQITSARNEGEGHCIKINGGRIEYMRPAAANRGTVILVEDLFYNVPARRKFLKSTTTENNHLLDIAYRYALSRPDISLKYSDGPREVFAVDSQNDFLSRIYKVFGAEAANNMLPLKYERDDLKISGYLGQPKISISNSANLFIYVLGRPVKDSLLNKAVSQAYGRNLASGRWPKAVIFIDVNPQEVDVNVHPAKTEVRFRNGAYIFQNIVRAVEEVLSIFNPLYQAKKDIQENNTLYQAKKDIQENNTLYQGKKDIQENNVLYQGKKDIQENNVLYQGKKDIQEKNTEISHKQFVKPKRQNWDLNKNFNNTFLKNFQEKEFNESDNNLIPWLNSGKTKGLATEDTRENRLANYNKIIDLSLKNKEIKVAADIVDENKKLEIQNNNLSEDSKKIFKENEVWQLKTDNLNKQYSEPTLGLAVFPIGQLNYSYILVQGPKGLYLIDQHAAHERILYNKLRNKIAQEGLMGQNLLFPASFDLPKTQVWAAEKLKQPLKRFGFTLEHFGGDTFVLKSVPAILGIADPWPLMMEILSEGERYLKEFDGGGLKENLNALANSWVYSLACRAAIKFGDKLSLVEMQKLIDDLINEQMGSFCPHGRLCVSVITYEELGKIFGRL